MNNCYKDILLPRNKNQKLAYPSSKREPHPGKNSGFRENHKIIITMKWPSTAFSANLRRGACVQQETL